MKFFQSLQAKYMLIIILALSIVQISYMVTAMFVLGITKTGVGSFLVRYFWKVKSRNNGMHNLKI